MKFRKLTLAFLLSLLVTGCFHIQLKGSVGEGTLTISPLRNPDNILATAISVGPDFLRELWGPSLRSECYL